ncbi:MAG TPA: MBL fold metallo-hydrolase [Anaerolineae bacterium]|nr:MBL fold metallo-hydrolase [Anaerolineae bacterium]
MKLEFLGAVRTVTGSMHVLTVGEGASARRILLDCGLFQGKRQESFERNRNLPFDAAGIDAMVLSHAHIDHSGSVPTLVKRGFRGNVLATPATRDLCAAMLRDSAHIQEEDVEYVNKKRAKEGLPPVEPLYTMDEATHSLRSFVTVGYGRPLPVVPGVTVTFHDAGHILGSALVVLDVEENGRRKRLLFTGDLGRPGLPILRDPEVVEGVDYLIIESTYGDRLHDPVAAVDKALRDVVLDTYRRGGKVIVPAFAVGRTQELVYALHQLVEARKIPDLPIYVDSPLAVNITEVFRLHPECYDADTNAFMASGNGRDPFGFYRLTYVRAVEASKELNFLRQPAIIISASGMAEAGRILHHLKNNVEDPNSTVLIVGWQAPHTLGRRLVERQPVVKIFGEEFKLRARVETINGFSAHADRDELLSYVRALGPARLQATFVVHGEEPSSLSLADGLRGIGVKDAIVPTVGQVVDLTTP